jgi:hypothetical protein
MSALLEAVSEGYSSFAEHEMWNHYQPITNDGLRALKGLTEGTSWALLNYTNLGKDHPVIKAAQFIHDRSHQVREGADNFSFIPSLTAESLKKLKINILRDSFNVIIDKLEGILGTAVDWLTPLTTVTSFKFEGAAQTMGSCIIWGGTATHGVGFVSSVLKAKEEYSSTGITRGTVGKFAEKFMKVVLTLEATGMLALPPPARATMSIAAGAIGAVRGSQLLGFK